MIPNKG